MDLKTAKNLKQGQTVWHMTKINADGTAMRAKVTSIKTWKTRPDEIIVRVKRGLKEFAEFHEYELNHITDDEKECIGND